MLTQEGDDGDGYAHDDTEDGHVEEGRVDELNVGRILRLQDDAEEAEDDTADESDTIHAEEEVLGPAARLAHAGGSRRRAQGHQAASTAQGSLVSVSPTTSMEVK